MPLKSYSGGVTLIELMIVIAIIALITAIAIPVYNGYIAEAEFAAARSNLEPLRLAMEDYWLENGTFTDLDGDEWDPSGNQTLSTGNLGWRPDGDNNIFKYTVVAGGTTSWTVEVEHINSGRKARCSKPGTCSFIE